MVSTASVVAVFHKGGSALESKQPVESSPSSCPLPLVCPVLSVVSVCSDPFHRVLVPAHMMGACPTAPLAEPPSEYISSRYSALHCGSFHQKHWCAEQILLFFTVTRAALPPGCLEVPIHSTAPSFLQSSSFWAVSGHGADALAGGFTSTLISP